MRRKWKRHRDHGNAAGEWDVCGPDAGDMIADLAKCRNARANAQLIAAAPAMQQAIEDLLAWAEYMGGWDAKVWNNARIAIGREPQE